MSERIINTVAIDCRGAGVGPKLQEVNTVPITKVVRESGVADSVSVGCFYLSGDTNNNKCLVMGVPCPHLHSKTSYRP